MAVALALSACSSEPQLSAEAARGQQLYKENCLACHGGKDRNADPNGVGAPPHNGEGHTWHHPDQLLTVVTLKGSEVVYQQPGMPAFEGRLNEGDVQDILAYLKTWWNAEQRARQAAATEQVRLQLLKQGS